MDCTLPPRGGSVCRGTKSQLEKKSFKRTEHRVGVRRELWNICSAACQVLFLGPREQKETAESRCAPTECAALQTAETAECLRLQGRSPGDARTPQQPTSQVQDRLRGSAGRPTRALNLTMCALFCLFLSLSFIRPKPSRLFLHPSLLPQHNSKRMCVVVPSGLLCPNKPTAPLPNPAPLLRQRLRKPPHPPGCHVCPLFI